MATTAIAMDCRRWLVVIRGDTSPVSGFESGSDRILTDARRCIAWNLERRSVVSDVLTPSSLDALLPSAPGEEAAVVVAALGFGRIV